MAISNSQFIPGQRWVSNTEAELGLGIIVEQVNRRVTISFPAASEKRTYAVDNAPLSRVVYSVGDRISNGEDLMFQVDSVEEKGGRILYHGLGREDEPVTLDELELDSFVRFSKPQDRLFAGQIDKNNHFKLRVETLAHQHRHRTSAAYGLLGPRVQLLPHQMYIAGKVSARHAPRVLLADEVGLGKTIEAGLIMHQQLIAGSIARVLVVVPDSLIHQWLVEMLRRFNLQFTILDEERCQSLEESGNPFESAQLVLCSLSFLEENAKRHEQALAAGWDMLVVDEAHHLAWSEEESSPAYQCVEALAKVSPALLLLTATPEQLGVDSHFARLRLLDPNRYYDLQRFRDEEASYQPVSELLHQLLDQDSAEALSGNQALVKALEKYLGKETVAALLTDKEADIEPVIQSLLDRHGTGRVLFRNTRDTVSGFPDRELHANPLPAPADWLSGEASLVEQLQPERLLGEGWLEKDPRVKWLADWLAEHRREKALVICASAETAQALEEHLRVKEGVLTAVFHEGMSLVARDRAAAYFAEHEAESAQVLVCSEIGSEGRNFQFVHHLVLFDLPINPDLLEQRIGRLDRIGQQHTVHIHVPHYENSAQSRLLAWYHQGINAIEQVCAVGTSLYQSLEDQLLSCLQSDDAALLDTLLKESQKQSDALLQRLQSGRDRLLELNSCRPVEAEQLIEAVESGSRSKRLATYMEWVFDQFGVEQEEDSLRTTIVRPGDHMQVHSFPGLPEDGLTLTFDRELALAREDVHFMSWEHPMVQGAMDMVLDEGFGNTGLCTIKLPGVAAGTLLLETIFTLDCPAPRYLQLHRYLAQPAVRVFIDRKGNDLGKIITAEHLNKLAERVPRQTAQNLVRHARDKITAMVALAEKQAATRLPAIIEAAREKIDLEQTAELNRLKALAEVNPNIRQEEIEYLHESNELLLSHLQHADLGLDAVRVVMAV